MSRSLAGPPSRVDFTSALFLGQRHPSAVVPPWTELTTGVPAVLRELPAATELASAVAAQQHAGSGLVARSALHGMMDILQVLPQPGDLLLVDAGAYPLTQWACRAAAARGVRVVTFPHFRPPAVVPQTRTWLVTDGWCQGCGRSAPLGAMQTLVGKTGGRVVVDDSLAFGVLGQRAAEASFGDGSGAVRWQGLKHDGVVWLGSLAKAYGTPVTVITGDRPTITRLARHGGNRLHSSPPSAADLGAGLSAVRDSRMPRLRDRLWRLTRWLRQAFGNLGLPPLGLPFPIVGTRLDSLQLARRWRSMLVARGVQVLVQLPRCQPGALLSAVVRADHPQADLDRLVRGLAAVTQDRRAA
ncbi:pyridoxal phosphate-dependent aminotransferase family protein [Arthrobacter sp. RT-1]|uniref:aminotransferase class I/II-fold pyridoxal phosphate-dependent enzyme n=1 Tax=Arthrobacter sp. RT-1 TaxID=2292263 RepID=UPI000E1F4765|nr:aminotransferase class I/II-fold pyridoxal phosphate-dependent enzyme [Arthrobacter sp. RT-1]RDV09382.1 pyridoxal phosphate-dependent aminotransferase family protein [Arthrobacter sp. RT-1]